MKLSLAKWKRPTGRWMAWIDLTLEERRFLLGILAIALVGLIARYLYLRGEKPTPYTPERIRTIEEKAANE